MRTPLLLFWSSGEASSCGQRPSVVIGAALTVHPESVFHGGALTLTTLAEQAGLPPLRLLRAFKAATGLPPHAYQTQLRLDRARTLLAAGLPPAEVALAVGFYDQSRLGRFFRATYGVTPGQYAAASRPAAKTSWPAGGPVRHPGAVTEPHPHSAAPAFGRGLRAFAPLIPGVVPFSMVAGIAAVQAGFTPAQSIAFSLIGYAGSAQLVASQMVAAHAPLP